MKKQILGATLAFCLVAGAISCSKKTDEDINIEKEFKSESLIKTGNQFGLDVFQLIHSSPKTPSNFMISPLSISLALQMAYNGAETDTRNQMAKAMRIEGLSRDQMNETYLLLVEALQKADPKVAMEIANSIWYRNTYSVEQNFLNVNKDFYNAEVEKADFDNPETVKQINKWVSDKTHEKIPKIINEIPAEAVLYLINAIYFKGSWSQEFNKESTQEMSFNLDENNYVQAKMMGRIDTLEYLQNETFSAIELPYGNGKFNMMVMLPNTDKTVADIVGQLTPENWNKWQSGLKLTNTIDIRLPKFKVEYETMLIPTLQAMGMELPFTAQADFSSINPARNLFISQIKHKTFIEVDEVGTEAAAVTIIGFETTSFDPNKPQKTYFHCDRPFIFAITEKETGTILFMGKIGNPSI